MWLPGRLQRDSFTYVNQRGKPPCPGSHSKLQIASPGIQGSCFPTPFSQTYHKRGEAKLEGFFQLLLLPVKLRVQRGQERLGQLRVGLGEDARPSSQSSQPDPCSSLLPHGWERTQLRPVSCVIPLWSRPLESALHPSFGPNIPLPIGLREFVKEGFWRSHVLGKAAKERTAGWEPDPPYGSQVTVTRRGLRLLDREETCLLADLHRYLCVHLLPFWQTV